MTSRELMHCAMTLGQPPRTPVMCQLAIGHALLQTGADPVDFFVSSDTYAETLLRLRAQYRFDGVLLHKPGRDRWFIEAAQEIERDASVPTLRLADGSRIECRRDDDPYYLPPDGFQRPAEIAAIDPADPLAWAPESYRRWCAHKGTAPTIPPHWFAAMDLVTEQVGTTHSIHGEVRSPLDHLAALVGLQEALMGLLTEPGHTQRLLETFTTWSVNWAVAQARRGCDAIKISSPYAGAGFISRDMYRAFVVPFESRIAAAVRAAGAIVYTHTCGAIGDRLDLLAETGVNGIEALDPPPLGTVDLATAKNQVRDRLFLKGNVNPVETLLNQDLAAARAEIAKVEAVGRAGGQFILSSACSVAPRTPAANVAALAECVYANA